MQTSSHACDIELHAVKLKVTPARLAAMKFFESHNTPVDAQLLVGHLHKTLHVDRVTAFRLLNTFTDAGLIKKIEFGEGKARYELNKEDHHHLICRKCGTVRDVSCGIDGLIKEIQNQNKFLIEKHSLEFFGLCKRCQI